MFLTNWSSNEAVITTQDGRTIIIEEGEPVVIMPHDILSIIEVPVEAPIPVAPTPEVVLPIGVAPVIDAPTPEVVSPPAEVVPEVPVV